MYFNSDVHEMYIKLLGDKVSPQSLGKYPCQFHVHEQVREMHIGCAFACTCNVHSLLVHALVHVMYILCACRLYFNVDFNVYIGVLRS
jgi:hypothetical protein